MGYEEIDIWHVLTKRKRMLRANKNVSKNEIFYYTIKDESFDKEKNLMLETLGVKVIEMDIVDNDYFKAYNDICKIIKNHFA